MKQKLLTLVLSLFAVVTAWAHDFEIDGIYYYITSETDLTVRVSYEGSYPDDGSNEYSGAVVIPESVTYNNKSYSVTEIGGGAFYGNRGLISIEIPSSVTSISFSAFYGCSGLTSVVIPSSVTSISSSAFYGCSGLTSVVIPSSVTEIGYYAFYGCSSLTSVEIPSSVTEIGTRAFEYCTNLKYNEYDNGLYLGNSENPYLYLVEAKSNEITSVKINDKTRVIADAFSGCSGLTSVEIPSGVTQIGDDAFEGCSGLTSVVILSGVTEIGQYAFSGCSGLTSVEIPSSVTEIGQYAFSGCSGLSSVEIPSSVTEIGQGAFFGCSGLSSVEIPSSVTEISTYTFSECSGLTSVTISEGVTEIGRYAFSGCNNLTSVTIPSTVTFIGAAAFPNLYDNGECKLRTITLLTKTNQPALAILGDYTDSYFHSRGYAAVYVADGLLPFYEWFWGGYYNFIEIGDVPNVINGEGGIASIVKVYNNKVDINVDLEEGYSVSEIKVNGKVVYTASASNKSLSVDVFVIKNSETSFTLVGVTADDTIEVAYNKSTPTGVGVIEMQREVKGVYDIYGRKLTAPQRGINIIDGKKVIVK